MATDLTIKLPDDLLAILRASASAEGKSVDELAGKALRLGLQAQQNVRDLHELFSWGERHARLKGHTPPDVQRAINEIRHER